MKNYIYKYYNINVDKIYKDENNYYFYINDEKIYIVIYKDDETKINTLFKICNDLYYKNIFVNTFILNNANQCYTRYNDCFISLLKVNSEETIFTFSDISKFFNIVVPLDNYDIITEWSNEIDIIEKELLEYNKEFLIIQNSVDYYIGLGENAIQLLSNIKYYVKENNNSIGHKLTFRLFERNTLNNPFMFIKTNKMYDISNYIKNCFFKKEIDYEEIDNILKKLNKYEEIFLFSCLMYPSSYFDLVKKILLREESEEKIQKYIKTQKYYYELLLYCKNHINNKMINKINWLK